MTTYLDNPSPRHKRIVKAHRKRYKEGKDLQTIAEEMGYAYDTIRGYFKSDSVEEIKEMYSEEELEFLKMRLFKESKEANRRADKFLGKAVSHDEVSPGDLIRAAKEEQKRPLRFVEMLQELDVLQKPKERKEVEQTGSEGVEFNISWMDEEDEKEESKQQESEQKEDKVEA